MTSSNRFFLYLYLPVVAAFLLVAAITAWALHDLERTHRHAGARQLEGVAHLLEAARHRTALASAHGLFSDAMERVRRGRLDPGQAAYLRDLVAQRLAEAEALAVAPGTHDPALAQARRADFLAYREAALRALALAPADLPAALREAGRVQDHYRRLARQAAALEADVSRQQAEDAQLRSATYRDRIAAVATLAAALLALLLVGWYLAARRLTAALAQLVDALRTMAGDAGGEGGDLGEVRRLAARPEALLHDLARAVLAFRDALAERGRVRHDLGERVKEMTCLYEVFQLTEREDLGREELLAAVARLLPPALRYPAQAVALVRVDDACGESAPAPAEGAVLEVPLAGAAGRGCVRLTYRLPLPPDAGDPWLAEERRLLEAVAARVSEALQRMEDRARERVAAREMRKLSQVVEQMPESVIVTDAEGNIVYVNPAFESASGYAREDVMGRNPRLLRSAVTPPATFTAMWAALRRGAVWQGELTTRRKDGSEFPEHAIMSAIREPGSDTITHFVAIKSDLTELRRMSAQLEAATAGS